MTKAIVAVHPTEARQPGIDAPEYWGEAVATRLDAPYPPPFPDRYFSRQIEQRAGFKMRAAWWAWRQPNADVFVSMAEQVAFPLELLNRRRRRPHIMVAHNLITDFKTRLHDRTRWLDWFEHIVVFSSLLSDHLTGKIGIDPGRVHTLTLPADARFYTPDPQAPVDAGLVVAIGREHRDYRTLMRAMRATPEARAIVVSNSPWAKSPAAGEELTPPANVMFSQWQPATELRALLASAAAVVVPLEANLQWAAGATAITEARAMGRPVIVTETPGIADYLDPSATLSVPADDAEALASTLQELLSDRPRA
ncbi:MAG: glycosyltransferase family 4 protein, partial [Acidimicrobiales bacterium]